MLEEHKWKIPKRKESNQEIIRILSKIVDENPDLRFGQILGCFVIEYEYDKINGVYATKDPFYEESVDTLKRVKEQYYGKDKV